MLEFIGAVYNEASEIASLVGHISPFVDRINFVDDGSTDSTGEWLDLAYLHGDINLHYKTIEHTGLPETVKAEALKMCADDSWVIMLDADERFAPGVLPSIRDFYNSSQADEYDYVYFRQLESIDGVVVREFQKSKLFRKSAITFPLENIHADDHFEGRGLYKENWVVHHRKTTDKQITREIEYLATYKKLLAEGKIDEGRYQWLVNLHHYVRPH